MHLSAATATGTVAHAQIDCLKPRYDGGGQGEVHGLDISLLGMLVALLGKIRAQLAAKVAASWEMGADVGTDEDI